MNDDTQSYVDSYNPPVAVTTPAAQDVGILPPQPAVTRTVPTAVPTISSSPTPPITTNSAKTVTTKPVSQALEDQNIFHLLGVGDASESEKESFLDELQQVIWEDFLEKDVELLLTEEEMVDLQKIMNKKDVESLDLQEEIIVFLEKLVPDLEEIMLEKALELKADMVRERIRSLREQFATQPEHLAELTTVDGLIADDQWREAAEVLNSLR